MVTRHPNPLANDLHIEFEKGGIEIKNKGTAEKAEFENDRRQTVVLTFPSSAPLSSGPYLGPVTPNPDGTIPAAPAPDAGTFVTRTFGHGDPTFPKITRWWWTHNVVTGRGPRRRIVNRPFDEHQGDPGDRKLAE
jgi:hypothetical protein